MTTYSLVLWAQTRGTLAGVATLRETSILFASLGVVTGILLIAHT